MSTFVDKQSLLHASDDELAYLDWDLDWRIKRRPKQRPPDGDWDAWVILAGRGWGKTRTSAQTLFGWAHNNPGTRWLVAARTISDLRATCFEGQSGLVSIAPKGLIIPNGTSLYHKTLFEMRVRTVGDGEPSLIKGISAENPESFRGPEHHGGWLDELAAWERMDEAWHMIQFGMRLGKQPKLVISTTPRPKKLIRQLTENLLATRTVSTVGTSYENLANLAPTFARQLLQYEDTRLGQQEIYAQILDDVGGIVSRQMFGLWHPDRRLPAFDEIVLSLDTAFTEESRDKDTGDPDDTAATVWGFWKDRRGANAMLLDAWHGKYGLPDLIDKVKEELQLKYGGDEQKPMIKPLYGSRTLGPGRSISKLLIEDKGSGISLRQMLNRERIAVIPYNPLKASKLERLHAVSHMVAAGMFWLPEGWILNNEGIRSPSAKPAVWGKRDEDPIDTMLEQLTTFKGKNTIEHDDYVDSCTQVWKLFGDYYGITTSVPKSQLDEEKKVREPRLKKNPYGSRS